MIVVTGATGQLGTALRQVLRNDAVFLTERDLDLADISAIREVIESLKPSILINAAAYTSVDLAEDERDLAMLINGEAVGVLAEVAADCKARFVTVSTDYVFDGSADRPYVESDQTNPINQYGLSKEAGERASIAANPESLVVRTSWLISGTHPNFVETMLRLGNTRELSIVDDQFGHPTLAIDLAEGIVGAVRAGASGILHLTNQGVTSWFGLAREVAVLGGIDPERFQPCTSDEYPATARRPRNSVLESERISDLGLTRLRHYREGLATVVGQLRGSMIGYHTNGVV
ncbi:MAG: dTDP-4-dehydrorhamnose reductase [Acidimicrobiia bacterium]